MSDDRDYTVTLHPAQQRFLEQAIEKYGLPDSGKALRCVINYAIEQAERDGSAEESIFTDIRCYDC